MKRILALLTALTAAPLAAAEPAPMITPGPVTFAVIGAYLAFLVLMGLAFRRFNRNTGDYFRSGSQGSWWLCGASAYVSATSAYTFTVAAGIGYTVGWSILLIYALSPLQFVLLGGIFVALLALPAHDLKGVLCPLGIGGAMMILGGAMLLIARRMPIPEETK